jgi:hypothetical protein
MKNMSEFLNLVEMPFLQYPISGEWANVCNDSKGPEIGIQNRNQAVNSTM